MTDPIELPEGADFDYYKSVDPSGRDTYTEQEQGVIESYLEEAYEAILAFTGNNWATSTGSTVPAKNIQCRIVRRYFENPDGITSESADGFTYSYNAADGITLTDREMASLSRLGIKKASGTWSSVAFNRGGGVLW